MQGLRTISISILMVAVYLTIVSCAPDKGSLFYGSLEIGEGRVIVASSVTASQTVSMFDIDGNFIKTLLDYTSLGGVPRGIAPYGSLGFLASVDGVEEFVFYNLLTGVERRFSNTLIAGNYYDIEEGPDGNYYTIESNTIERFDVGGARFPASGATPAIPTTIGGCTLSVPTGLAVNTLDELVVVNTTGNTLLRYTLSSTGASSCVSTALPNNPRGIIAHSDGFLYATTIQNANETVVRMDATGGSQTVIWSHAPTIIQDAYAIVELPNSHLLVSSAGTDAILEITTDGDFVRTWARDGKTIDIQNMFLLSGEG